MTALVTTDEARRQLRLTTSDMEVADTAADVADKMIQATAIIADYIDAADNDWDTDTVPVVVKTAILLMLTELFENGADADITMPIRNVLRRTRPISLA